MMFLSFAAAPLLLQLFLPQSGIVLVAEAWTASEGRHSRGATIRRVKWTRTQHLRSTPTTNNFNVVLSPSDFENAAAFDNYKVGNCRVHRYARDADSEETEYVMWYHGRSRAMQEDPACKLPPLSTGRIGRAISRNGLVWEKDTKGSVSEDIPGVALGLNRDSWWGFDTAHVGLGSVLLPLSTPAIMSADGVYLMYYMGGSGQETLLSKYLDEGATIPDSLKDAVLQGMDMKIGVALSQDGVSWGRVEGDDPSGACLVPFRNSDPNQSSKRDANNNPILEELYCAWPEVIVNPAASSKAESFVMFYSTMTVREKKKCIAHAVSEDGFRWFKRGICVEPEQGDALDAKGCARCCVVTNAIYDKSTQQWTDVPQSWKMFYEGVSPLDNKHRIFEAESNDLFTWTKVGLALDVGDDGAWDVKGVSSPHCIRYVKWTERVVSSFNVC
jgi:hypothetical protein